MTKPTAILEARAKAEFDAAGSANERHATVDARAHLHAGAVLRELIPQIEALGAEGSELEQACAFLRGLAESPNAAHRHIGRYYPNRYEVEVEMLLQTARDLGWKPGGKYLPWQPSPRPAPAAPAHELPVIRTCGACGWKERDGALCEHPTIEFARDAHGILGAVGNGSAAPPDWCPLRADVLARRGGTL